MYIHEYENWTDFRWDSDRVSLLIDAVCREQGRLYGRLDALGLDSRLKAMAYNLTRDVVESSEIEGVRLNDAEVRSSIARRLGIEGGEYVRSSHYVDGVVAVMLEAMEHYDAPLTRERLCGWQSAFFPTGYSEGLKIEVGAYRTHDEHIVSGSFGRERIHYIAPSPDRIEGEMERFVTWFNSDVAVSSVVRSAIAHLWFVSIHPFEDGNGRLARILGDMMLARGDRSRLRFYNISSAVNRDKRHYYDLLERTQRGDGDITDWLVWYLQMLLEAIGEADRMVSTILNKSIFWMHVAGTALTERQTRTLNMYLDGYEAKITSKNWAAVNKCSRDTAVRDIQDLVAKGILRETVPGAKRPSYSIRYVGGQIEDLFDSVDVVTEDGVRYLTAVYKGRIPVRERILSLDAESYDAGSLQLSDLLGKYCAYLVRDAGGGIWNQT